MAKTKAAHAAAVIRRMVIATRGTGKPAGTQARSVAADDGVSMEGMWR